MSELPQRPRDAIYHHRCRFCGKQVEVPEYVCDAIVGGSREDQTHQQRVDAIYDAAVHFEERLSEEKARADRLERERNTERMKVVLLRGDLSNLLKCGWGAEGELAASDERIDAIVDQRNAAWEETAEVKRERDEAWGKNAELVQENESLARSKDASDEAERFALEDLQKAEFERYELGTQFDKLVAAVLRDGRDDFLTPEMRLLALNRMREADPGCNCNPLNNTGGGHSGSCPSCEPESREW